MHIRLDNLWLICKPFSARLANKGLILHLLFVDHLCLLLLFGSCSFSVVVGVLFSIDLLLLLLGCCRSSLQHQMFLFSYVLMYYTS